MLLLDELLLVKLVAVIFPFPPFITMVLLGVEFHSEINPDPELP